MPQKPTRKARASGDADANRAIHHGRGAEVRQKIAAQLSQSQALAQDIADLCQRASRISQELPLPKHLPAEDD